MQALLQEIKGSLENTTGLFCRRYKALLQEIQATFVRDCWLVKIHENLAEMLEFLKLT